MPGLTKRETPRYALAFSVESEELCAFCFNNILHKIKYPDLLLTMTKPRKVLGKDRCPKCNLPYFRGQTEEAAKCINDHFMA